MPRSTPSRNWFMLLVGTQALLLGSPLLLGQQPQNPVDFSHDVLPVLKARCAKCHTAGTYKGKVSLDTREALVASKAVTPGHSGNSILIERITHTDPKMRMPPTDDPLSAQQVATLQRWIDEGLPWQDGFSFGGSKYVPKLALRRPELPPAQDGRTHPLDRIVDAYLGLHNIPRPPSLDDGAFARRAHLDIIGLLPTRDEYFAVVDSKDPARHEKLIRSLLARDRDYADHWLTFWNDHLRNDYAGPGYIDGGRKQITPWLYQSLLANKPYDQFVRELISPNAEAEGFIYGIQWRGNVNASQVREVQFAQNVGQVFLGVNLKCASCHDSFIDDWKLDDAYGMAAIISDHPLEIHRCDKATGNMAVAKFIYPELGQIDAALPPPQRLTQLAGLLTKPENGRFARTIVNRLWHRLMGRGIVYPVDVMSNEPWSEELLDYLAVDLIDQGYDLKKTIELICTSQVYRSQSVVLEKELPAMGYVYRGPIAKRLTAEQFADAVWQITGTGPGKPDAPLNQNVWGEVTASAIQLATASTDLPKLRVRAALVNADPLMRSLGRPNREQVVTTRPEELTTLQALDLSNGQILYDLLMQGARNIEQGPGRYHSKSGLIQWIYVSAVGRVPTPAEQQVAMDVLGDRTQESVADLLWSVLMLPEFQLVR